MGTGTPVPATSPVTGPTGAVDAPSAPMLSFVITVPLTLAVFSVIVAVSAFAIGASSIMAMLNVLLMGTVLLATSLRLIAISSVTAITELGGVSRV